MKCEHSDLNLSYSFQRSLKADDWTNNISQLLQISSSPYPKKVQHSCLTIKPSLVVWIKIQREEFEMIFHRIFPVCWVCIKIVSEEKTRRCGDTRVGRVTIFPPLVTSSLRLRREATATKVLKVYTESIKCCYGPRCLFIACLYYCYSIFVAFVSIISLKLSNQSLTAESCWKISEEATHKPQDLKRET